LVEKQEFYDTKELRCRYFVFSDRPEVKQGKYEEFYKSGARKLTCEYQENLVEGPVTYWYEDGKEALRGTFKKGLRDGEFAEFHPSGNPKIEATYAAGKLEGTYREFYDAPDKPVMIEKTYANGALAAPWTMHRLDGGVKYSVGLDGKQTSGDDQG